MHPGQKEGHELCITGGTLEKRRETQESSVPKKDMQTQYEIAKIAEDKAESDVVACLGDAETTTVDVDSSDDDRRKRDGEHDKHQKNDQGAATHKEAANQKQPAGKLDPWHSHSHDPDQGGWKDPVVGYGLGEGFRVEDLIPGGIDEGDPQKNSENP